MKYIRIFEDFSSDILYHGSPDGHSFNNRGNLLDGTFFSTDESEAESYGKHVSKVELVGGLRLFDSLDYNDLKLLFDEFDELYDTYYSEDDPEYYITSPEDMPSSDTWEPIENTEGVIDWIRNNGYDGIWIYEGGIKNLFLFSPVSDKLKTHQ